MRPHVNTYMPRNLPGLATLGDCLEVLLEENQKFSQIQQDKSYQKYNKKFWMLWVRWEKFGS